MEKKTVIEYHVLTVNSGWRTSNFYAGRTDICTYEMSYDYTFDYNADFEITVKNKYGDIRTKSFVTTNF